MISMFLTFFRRNIKIQRVSQYYDIAELIINHGNGKVFSLLMSPNEIKRMCSVFYHMQKEYNWKVHSCTMSLQRQEETIEFEVPDWARKKFDSELRRFCFEELN